MTGQTRDGAKQGAKLGEVSLLLAAFFVGTDFVSVKYALRGLPPLAPVPLRHVVAGGRPDAKVAVQHAPQERSAGS